MKNLRRLLFQLTVLIIIYSCGGTDESILKFGNEQVAVVVNNTHEALFTYQSADGVTSIAPAVFEIDGQQVEGVFSSFEVKSEGDLPSQDAKEYIVVGMLAGQPDVSMQLVVQMPNGNSMIRFKYQLTSSGNHKLTKSGNGDNLTYIKTDLSGYEGVTEVRLSEFFELPHTYLPTEHQYGDKDFDNSINFMGPICIAEGQEGSALFAYEHGSQLPDRYLQFQLMPDKNLIVQAVKGNYYDGQVFDKDHPYSSVWFILGQSAGDKDELAKDFRSFVLHNMSPNTASRKPYIFYNSWNFQERNKAWYGNPYLHNMTSKRMLQEIDVAHNMGIDVFVIDAGWFGKTGDWEASRERFPDDLEEVRKRMDGYGMKMGLWFNASAAMSSDMLAGNKQNVMSYDGHVPEPHQVWETEESLVMCMVSEFYEDYADELIRVAEKYGVRYFKWDAFPQYGCNAPGHFHGTETNTSEERAHNYSFLLPIYMAKVVDKICAKYPDAIVDFDLTEGERAFGLGFLAAGKFFGINNGPYYFSLDDPELAPGGGMGANVLVFPGIARAANARKALAYDKWIPSTLFLTHYLPDDPEYSQWLNLGSLILGQNGIWGDLPKLSAEGVKRFGETLGKYKQVRDDITQAYPITKGEVGGSPEIHEKINPETGKGTVVIFYNYKNAWNSDAENAFPGTFSYVTENIPDQRIWENVDAEVTFDDKGRAVISHHFTGPGALILFFGVDK